MHTIDPQVESSIRDAITHGDTEKLRALAGAFPQSFEALRDSDLVDLAVRCKKAGPALYLILAHHFETSPMFEYNHRAFLGDLFAEGVNQYHTTLEVMASAPTNFAREPLRGLACGDVREFIYALQRKDSTLPLHPEFYRAAANGDLQQFTTRLMADERYPKCGNRHSVTMLRAIDDSHATLADYARQLRRAAGTCDLRSGTSPRL